MLYLATMRHDNVILRPATLEDLPILLSFEQGIIEAERPFDPTLGLDISYYDIGEMIVADDVEVVVAVVSGNIIGSAYAAIRQAKPYLDHNVYTYLGFMFVTQEFRGHGINGQIIDYLVAWSKSRGISELRLDVYDDNIPALRAYEKAGFKRHLVNMRIRV